MLLALALELLVAAVVVLFFWMRRPRRLSDMGDRLPGPTAYPIFGNALELGTNTTEFFYAVEKLCKKYYGAPFRVWVGNKLFVLLTLPKDIEVVMGSNKLIDKSYNYKFLHPWLGTGLLTSTGNKWHRHRKILTPTFHFKILEEFVDIFYANGEILVDCLRERVGGPGFNVHHYVTLNTLDNICESAMGMKINAQRDADSEYVKAIRDQSDIAMQRSFKPWLQSELIFTLIGLRARQKKALTILHSTTNEVIRARRQEMTKERAARGGSTGAASVTEDGVKRRLAFLDLLIQSTFEGSELTDENIREEVDTFMFEGHDTTSACISFALWLLAWNQDIQAAAVQELTEVWVDCREPLTFVQLQQLKYLERVIKETLRLFPSVPLYGRQLAEDTVFSGGLVVPKDASVMFVTYMAHKDPAVFPDPERFDPDRFLPDNVQGRHPYAYTPFSAGPRNCIGQKFALLEMKCTVAQVLRSYKLLPGSEKQTLRLSADLILTAKDGVPVTIEPRP